MMKFHINIITMKHIPYTVKLIHNTRHKKRLDWIFDYNINERCADEAYS